MSEKSNSVDQYKMNEKQEIEGGLSGFSMQVFNL